MKKYYDNTVVGDIELNIYTGNYAKALYLAEKYIEDYPEDRLGPVYRARALGLNGNIEEAIELFESSLCSKLHDRSSYLVAYTWYGLMLFNLNRKEDAEKQLLCALTYEDRTSGGMAIKARVSLSNIYVDNMKFEEALDIISVSGIDQDLVNNKKAYIYMMMGNYEEAIKCGKKVRKFKNDANEQMNRFNIGKSYYLLGKFKEAKEYLSMCLTTKTKYYYSAISLLGKTAYVEKEYDLATNYANQLLSSDDLREDGNRLLFRINCRLGKMKEAKEYLDQIKNYKDRHYYSLYYYYSNGEYHKALESCPHVLSIITDKRFVESLRTYISSLIRLGKYDEAEYIINCVDKDLEYPFITLAKTLICKTREEEYNDISFYSAKQLNSYDEEETIRHILNHHLLGDSSKFFDKESIREVLNAMKEKIKDMDPIPSDFSDKYLVHYDNVGYDETGILNTLEVVTNMNSNEIITIYPLSGTDIYEAEDIKKKEIKKESQIDKFYKRYGKK